MSHWCLNERLLTHILICCIINALYGNPACYVISEVDQVSGEVGYFSGALKPGIKM